MSPSAISKALPSRFVRGLEGLTSARTRSPRAASKRATAEPTKPDAPVTRTRSSISGFRRFNAGESTAAFHRLPDQQDRNADRDFSCALEQRGADAELRRETEQGHQRGVTDLLHADRGRNKDEGTAQGAQQRFDAQRAQQTDPP